MQQQLRGDNKKRGTNKVSGLLGKALRNFPI